MAFYYGDNIPEIVNGDALRVKQILTNLISNAIKFTPDGEIIVRVRMEHDDIGQCLLHFSVQDSGIGLSGTDRKKLFESFSQGDASVTRQFGGTGLGLAISKQWCNSCTVILVLKTTKNAHQPKKAQHSGLLHNLKPKTILFQSTRNFLNCMWCRILPIQHS